MDSYDVSQLPEYAQLLLKRKNTILEAQSRKGQKPDDWKPRDETILQFNFHRLMRERRVGSEQRTFPSSFVPPAYPPCLKTFYDLRKVMLKDLCLETQHRGSFLLVRSVTPPDRLTAIMAIVEDESGQVLMLQVYHRESECERAAEEVLGEGVILVIKEPYLKRIPNAWKRGMVGNTASAISLKRKGNDYFKQSKHYLAIDCYTQALDCSPTADEARTIRLNRSLTFLKTKQFDAALLDAESSTATDKPTEKALFRRAQALYQLQRYRDCCDVLKRLCSEYPNNSEARNDLNRAIRRLVEQEKGRFEFKKMQDEAARLRPPYLDHSTYIGPVSIRASGSRGRGLFTTEAVRAGDLLFCEKAFEYAFIDLNKPDAIKDVTLLIKTETDSMSLGMEAELITRLIRKLYRNPSLASNFTDLYHGSQQPVDVSEVDGHPVVDTFLVERIVALNSFGCGVSSRATLPRLEGNQATAKTADLSQQVHSSGIWLTASYINHSCYSHVRRSFIGDMMVVRATQDLAAGTELAWWYYTPVSGGYEKRDTRFRNWGFTCDCVMCQDDHITSKTVMAERKRLRAEVKKHLESPKRSTAAKIKKLVAAISSTYKRPASEVPHLAAWDSQLALAEMYMDLEQYQKTIEWTLKSLTSLGFVIEGGSLPRTPGTPIRINRWGLMVDTIIKNWILLSTVYLMVAPDLVVQAEGYARLSYRICAGEDESFEETYGRRG